MRDCGTCIACCVYYNIKTPQLHKEAFSPCTKLKTPPLMQDEPEPGRYTTEGCDNCTVHKDDKRPKVCDDFNCYWLLGHGDEEDRPDKSGMIIDRSKRITNAHEAKPLWNGAGSEEMLTRMSQSVGTPLIVLSWGEMKIDRIVGRSA